MKKVLIIILLMSLLLTGCHKGVPIELGEEESSTVSTETEDTMPSFLPPETTSSFQPVQEETKPEETTEATVPPQIIQQQTHSSEEQVESESEGTETVKKLPEADIPPATEAPQSTEIQETQQSEETAVEIEPQPTEDETASSFQPVTESEPETSEAAEVTEETQEETEPTEPFDIGIWVSFAQGYGSKGIEAAHRALLSANADSQCKVPLSERRRAGSALVRTASNGGWLLSGGSGDGGRLQ